LTERATLIRIHEWKAITNQVERLGEVKKFQVEKGEKIKRMGEES
jgi:hypothetical protein